jgi:hypothetical protein
MSAFTSKASGDWAAAGQTTWNESGTPGRGDAVTIDSPDTVTVSDSAAVGDGGDNVLTIASGATLALAAGVELLVEGSIDNAGSIDLGAGAAIRFAVFAALSSHFPKTSRPRPFAPGLAR